MKQKQIVTIGLIILGIIAVIGGTFITLSLLNDEAQKPATQQPETSAANQPNEETPTSTPGEKLDEGINSEINGQAASLDSEAAALMSTNPAAARDKYLAAKEMYLQAGNFNKAQEMQSSADTAEYLSNK